MNIYIWERIQKCSNRFHPAGGVVIFSSTLERAIELAKESGCEFEEGEETPDFTAKACHATERVFIFPDAGCC